MFVTPDESRLATALLQHSVKLQKGENILLQLIDFNGIGLLRALTEQAREIGAHPFVKIEDPEINRILLARGDQEFWSAAAEKDQLPLMKNMDCFIGIRGSRNIYENSQVPGNQQQVYAKYFQEPVHMKQRVNHTRWCILRFPSESFAMNAKMPTEAFREFYYEACLLNYSKLQEAMKPLHERLLETDEIHLVGEGTDIRFSVKGQNWVPCYGSHNIPDGELFSSPILDSVEGHITYAPSVYNGKPFEFVKLVVEKGVVVDFDSSNNDALRDILDSDEGARRFGEFSFGLNPVIESPMYDILFDEKIYGSNHLTLGNDYEEASNGNDSTIHWDLVCIGADVYFDGELVRKGREFVDPALVGLNPDALLG